MWSRWADLLSGASLDPIHRYCFGGAVSGDQGGINNRSLAHCHALREDVGLDRLEDFLPQVVLLEQMPDAEIRYLIRDLFADQFDAGETPHGGTSISASSMAGSLRLYHCCNRWIRSMVANGYGGLPPFLLVLG